MNPIIIHGHQAVDLLRSKKVPFLNVTSPWNRKREFRMTDPDEAAKLVGTHGVSAFIKPGSPVHQELSGGGR